MSELTIDITQLTHLVDGYTDGRGRLFLKTDSDKVPPVLEFKVEVAVTNNILSTEVVIAVYEASRRHMDGAVATVVAGMCAQLRERVKRYEESLLEAHMLSVNKKV